MGQGADPARLPGVASLWPRPKTRHPIPLRRALSQSFYRQMGRSKGARASTRNSVRRPADRGLWRASRHASSLRVARRAPRPNATDILAAIDAGGSTVVGRPRDRDVSGTWLAPQTRGAGKRTAEGKRFWAHR